MQEKVITFASPIFFLLIALEAFVAMRRHRHEYRVNDAINSLSLGVMSQIINVFLKLLSIGIYVWVAQHFAITTLPADQPWVWLTGLLLYDFLYYWLHRMGHMTNLLWAAHVVHHQSEHYNLSTALRQTSSGHLFAWIFYLPMALLGYPAEVFIAVGLIDLLYQFWIHTQQIGKLGWFDRVFASPSNHRVHHAVNDICLDKNFGGILILWDRLFGTFIEEQDAHPVVFGTRKPLRSWNPFWANAEVYAAVLKDALSTRRWVDKFKIWLMPPGWQPADLAARSAPATFDLQRAEYNPPLRGALMWYCLAQFALGLNITTHFLLSANTAGSVSLVLYALWLLAGFWIIGGLMQQQKFFMLLEGFRIAICAAMVLTTSSWFGITTLTGTAQACIIAACAACLLALLLIFKTKPHGYLSY
ncbi:MAG: sterol desaturase family protein [Burkholderiaceae bacterium]|nr:sterol desaturase family protein [Burkholderiaceae bacterium]